MFLLVSSKHRHAAFTATLLLLVPALDRGFGQSLLEEILVILPSRNITKKPWKSVKIPSGLVMSIIQEKQGISFAKTSFLGKLQPSSGMETRLTCVRIYDWDTLTLTHRLKHCINRDFSVQALQISVLGVEYNPRHHRQLGLTSWAGDLGSYSGNQVKIEPIAHLHCELEKWHNGLCLEKRGQQTKGICYSCLAGSKTTLESCDLNPPRSRRGITRSWRGSSRDLPRQ